MSEIIEKEDDNIIKYYNNILQQTKYLNDCSRHDNLILSTGMYYDYVSPTSYQYPKFTTGIDSDQLDYCRFRELELLAQELKRRQVPGQLAEVGVYRGDFAAKIARIFPDKKLYLFDTFSGFRENDVEWEKEQQLVGNGFLSLISQFGDVCIETVLNKIHCPERCEIRQGYFPDSLDGMEDIFCFVSIDVDLYQPTLKALQYFYPRLSRNGYIMLHDYNHDELLGVKKAVLDYEKEMSSLIAVPVPDQCGTLIITK